MIEPGGLQPVAVNVNLAHNGHLAGILVNVSPGTVKHLWIQRIYYIRLS